VAASFRQAAGERQFSVGIVASSLGYSRQYVYKQSKDAAKKQSKEQAIKQLVARERKQLPRIGTRKIHYLIKSDLQAQRLKFGRDKLFELMRLYGLQIKPRRSYTQTTMSRHWLRKWPNIINQKVVSYPDEVWVSDITYVKTEEGNCYLNMITDAFSRKIVGYAVGDNMETETMIKALKMAIGQKRFSLQQTIHHSDRGVQYCSKEYELMTRQHNIALSMTENGDPYENALAERMNRTIKEEFGMDKTLKNKEQVKLIVPESIFLYNQKRPHLALKMKTPEYIYQTKIPAT
jgi:putative transposase